MRSVFGERIVPLRSVDDVDNLRKRGIQLTDFDGPSNIQNERLLYESGTERLIHQVLELLPKNAQSLESIENAATRCSDVLLDMIFRSKNELTCFVSAPQEQMNTFVTLLFESTLFQTEFPIVSPVCPDYGDHGYTLKSGISATAKRSIDAFRAYRTIFTDHGVKPHLSIHLADVEATDPIVLAATGETPQSFLAKLERTQLAITDYIESKNLSDHISVSSMRQFCTNRGLSYDEAIRTHTERILSAQEKGVRSAHSRLFSDRTQNSDYKGITQISPELMAANELAGYSVYGQAVDATAFIASPDASSAIPAYNFFQPKEKKNATAYVKRGKGDRI